MCDVCGSTNFHSTTTYCGLCFIVYLKFVKTFNTGASIICTTKSEQQVRSKQFSRQFQKTFWTTRIKNLSIILNPQQNTLQCFTQTISKQKLKLITWEHRCKRWHQFVVFSWIMKLISSPYVSLNGIKMRNRKFGVTFVGLILRMSYSLLVHGGTFR